MSLANVTYSYSVQNEIIALNRSIVLFVRCAAPIIFALGVTCNLLNIFVFTRPSLRRNPCCMYFLSSSVAALIYHLVEIPFRFFQFGFNLDPTRYLLSICKLRYYFAFTWRAITSWFIVLACLDRFLHSSSNANLRRLSSFKVASRMIPLTFLLLHVTYSHVLIFYTITSKSSCTSESDLYGTCLGVWHLLVYGIGPPVLMLLFSLTTVQRVRHRAIMPVTTQPNQVNRNTIKDAHLLRMVFLQSIFVGFITTLYAATQLYTQATSNNVKDNLQIAKENLITGIFGSLSVTSLSATFFVFTLASKMFRQELLCRRQERV